MQNRKKYCFIILISLGLISPTSIESKVFPRDEWAIKTPTELNINQEKIDHLFNLSFADDATQACLLYTSPSPRDQRGSRMPSSA